MLISSSKEIGGFAFSTQCGTDPSWYVSHWDDDHYESDPYYDGDTVAEMYDGKITVTNPHLYEKARKLFNLPKQ